ncbi:MAG: competence protein F [Fimbriimonadales bacterium]
MFLVEGLLDLLFPPRCGVCDGLRRTVFCDDCRQLLEPISGPVCPRCGRPGGACDHCPEQPAPCRSAFRYDGAAGAAVRRLKYDRVYALGNALGELLAEAVRAWPEVADVDEVIPVPIHASRQRQRTFNQAELIARPVAEALGLNCATDVLVRHRRTPPQVGRTRQERRRNIAGAFRVVNRGRVTGRSFMLVDDVYTSGYTLGECAGELMAAGASHVTALTVCRED